jgi:predicted PurR-regulated permease PerM
MTVLVQLILALIVGVAAWFVSELLGIADPWPVVIGVIAGLLCLGLAVIVVDGDMF